jgi:hypothetical protein
MKLTAEQALELSGYFRNISVALGDFRFKNWDSLTKDQRQKLENLEWTLLNYSSDLITVAVGVILDDAQGSLDRIQKATKRAKKTIETIQKIKKVIDIGTAFIRLGGAIVTGNTETITSAVINLFAEIGPQDK